MKNQTTRQYPKLIGAIHTVFRLAKGALIVDRAIATHFCSVKVNGEDVYLYILDRNSDPVLDNNLPPPDPKSGKIRL